MSDKHYVHPHDENQLANALKNSRSWVEQYGTTVIYGIAAVLGITAIAVYIQRTPAATAPASAALLSAENETEYQDVADQFENTSIGYVARLQQADLLAGNAVNNMFRNRKVALEEIESARAAYERLVDVSDLPVDLKVRVLAGLARLTECENDGSEEKTKTAIGAWQRIIDEFPDSPLFKKLAEDRISHLKRESTRQFYAWFHKQEPKPGDDSLMPQDRPSSSVPEIPNPLDLNGIGIPGGASIPGISTPLAPGGSSESTTPAAPTEGAAPAEGTTPPAATPETPAAEQPVPEQPAPEQPAQPAAEQPAAEQPALEQPAAQPSGNP